MMRKMITVACAVLLCLMLTVAAVADTLVSSVTAKPAPEVGSSSTSGNSTVVEVKDETGKVVASAQTIKIEVTPVSAVVQPEDPTGATVPGETVPAETVAEPVSEEVAAELKAAYEQLSDENTDVVAVVKGLDEVLQENQVEAADLVVKDLFHVDIEDETVKEYLAVEGNTITLNFKADIQEGQFVTVAVLVDGEWILVENVVVLEDGSIDVTLAHLGTIAIFVDGAQAQAAEVSE